MALTLAMVLHELATNAVKYGALSTPAGRVDLSWELDGGEGPRRLHISWDETGGPAVEKPARRGFGTQLVERAVEKELHGAVDLAFSAVGVRCRLEVPIDR